MLLGPDVARHLGIQPATWRGYYRDGRTPEPDGWIGGKPWWLAQTIDSWERPGQGARTDLRRESRS
jgi:hypothetical protein